MKKLLNVFISLSLLLALCACGEKAPAAFDPAADAQALLSADGVFSGALEEIDRETACAIYGIDPGAVTAAAVYMTNATSAEELAIFTFSGEGAAADAAKALGYRVEDRKEGLADYLPNELPKLEKAVVETRGASVLLLIAADYAPAQKILDK